MKHENFLDQLMREKKKTATLTIKIKQADTILAATIRSIPLSFAEGFMSGSKDTEKLTVAEIQEAWDKSQMKAVLIKSFGAQEAPNVTIQ